ncbi:MAG: Transcriptional regulator [Rhodobacteraceae bacterium HLUCCO18]|nr:MAG: Transcriptional regulator [Rhodobacteraceae bacterium HLUCCO18]
MKSECWNWSDLRVFLAVLDAGSTLAASKALGMAQPTVARRIDALEHATGLVLFERDTRGARPTAAARELEPEARAVAEAVAAFERNAGRTGVTIDRPIRLTAPKSNFSENLAAALADFTDLHPGVRFEYVASNEYVDLIAGDADVAIRFGEIGDDRLICRKLTISTASVYASRTYAERHGLPAGEHDLAGHRFMGYDPLRRSFPVYNWLLERISLDQIVGRFSDPESIVPAVRAGLGLGVVPTTLAEEAGLVRCFPPPEGTAMAGHLVMTPEAWRRPEVKAFAKFFVPRFRSYIRKKH